MVTNLVKQGLRHDDITRESQDENWSGPPRHQVVGYKLDPGRLLPARGMIETTAVAPVVLAATHAISLAAAD
jgi:hypothetical protein